MLIFHDDQHGTAVVTLAGLFNALKISGKDIKEVKIIINRAGAPVPLLQTYFII